MQSSKAKNKTRINYTGSTHLITPSTLYIWEIIFSFQIGKYGKRLLVYISIIKHFGILHISLPCKSQRSVYNFLIFVSCICFVFRCLHVNVVFCSSFISFFINFRSFFCIHCNLINMLELWCEESLHTFLECRWFGLYKKLRKCYNFIQIIIWIYLLSTNYR